MGLGYRHIQEAIERNAGWADYSDNQYTSGSPFLLTTASGQLSLPNNCANIIEFEKPDDLDAFYFTKLFEISSVTGTFVIGETVTGGTSTETARIDRIVGTTLMVNAMSGNFTATEGLTGSTSGATATLTTINNGRIAGHNGHSRSVNIEFKVKPSGVGNNPRLKMVIDIGGSIGEIYPIEQSLTKGNGVEHYFLASFGIYTLNTFEDNGGIIKVQSINEDLEIYDIRYVFFASYTKLK